jgi:hypothetical protein
VPVPLSPPVPGGVGGGGVVLSGWFGSVSDGGVVAGGVVLDGGRLLSGVVLGVVDGVVLGLVVRGVLRTVPAGRLLSYVSSHPIASTEPASAAALKIVLIRIVSPL